MNSNTREALKEFSEAVLRMAAVLMPNMPPEFAALVADKTVKLHDALDKDETIP